MIRLVSQFDSDKTRISIATPTCGGCCSCCCSCIVTTLVSSVITARNLGRTLETQTSRAPSPDGIKIKISKWPAYLYGFFLLPISIAVGLSVLIEISEMFIITPLTVFTVFGSGLYWLKKKYGLSTKTTLLIFFITVGALIAEFFSWFYLVFD